MEEEKKVAPVRKKEIVWYSIGGGLAFVGLVFAIFGIIGDHLPVAASDNWVIVSENAWLKNWSGMGYRWWGLILLGIGVLIGVIALCAFAGSTDKDTERAARRAKRLAALNAMKDAVGPVSDVTPTEVKEDK